MINNKNSHVNFVQTFIHNKFIIIVFLSSLFIIFMTNTFATVTPIKTITFSSTALSYLSNEEGSWQLTESASWTSKNIARVNIGLKTLKKNILDYTDVILVLDISGTMRDSKLTQLQNDVNNLITNTINNGNKMALITYNDSATIVSGFTDDASLLQDSINNLVTSGETSYYQALVKVDEILSTYNKKSNRDCVVLFLADGLPTVDTPNEVTQYKYLKNTYDYLVINGIQYEAEETLFDEIDDITDTSYVAYKNNLAKYLQEASMTADYYDSIVLTDYIDTNYFNLDNVDNITVTSGSTSIENNKVIWKLSNLKSGTEEMLTFDIKLNENLSDDTFKLSTQTDVAYKIDLINTLESTTNTPILKNNYTVIYEANAPTGCSVTSLPSSKNYSVFDTVAIEDVTPVCEGYQFQGFVIETAGVEKLNDDNFIMPEENVIIRATWKKLSLNKSYSGTVTQSQSLRQLIASNSLGIDTNIDFNEIPTDDNSGIYTKSGTETDKFPVYYYRGNVENNNIVFAGFCWKIVRTTSTGGIKLVYNGTYSSTNKCSNTGTSSQIGTSKFNSSYSSPADAGYMYGTRYTTSEKSASSTSSYIYGNDITWDGENYTLVDTYTSLNGWSTDRSSIAKKYHYSCLSTSSECSTVYYIHYFNSSSTIYSFALTNGKNIDDLLEEMFISTTPSTIKETVDTWYLSNMDEYTEKLEDTPFCNDRSFSSGALAGKDVDAGISYSYYSASGRIWNSFNPSITCLERDSFTLKSSTYGNKSLTYPVGLLSVDEVMLAGGKGSSNSSYYLYTGQNYWTMSSSSFATNSVYGFIVTTDGTISNYRLNSSLGVRPVVSLAQGIRVTDGNGTVTSPYILGDDNNE